MKLSVIVFWIISCGVWMSHMVLIESLLKWSNWETTSNPLLGDSQSHRSTLKALKHTNLFDYEILQGEFLFSSVGESWETLPYSKPKSTRSYTNKYLVFKGLCLLNGEVPSVFPQAWTLQRESESTHIRCWVWGAGAPLLIIGKKGRNLGYSHSSTPEEIGGTLSQPLRAGGGTAPLTL